MPEIQNPKLYVTNQVFLGVFNFSFIVAAWQSMSTYVLLNNPLFTNSSNDNSQCKIHIHPHENQAQMIKVAFFSESAIRFSNIQISKKNIPKNYPELEI